MRKGTGYKRISILLVTLMEEEGEEANKITVTISLMFSIEEATSQPPNPLFAGVKKGQKVRTTKRQVGKYILELFHSPCLRLSLNRVSEGSLVFI